MRTVILTLAILLAIAVSSFAQAVTVGPVTTAMKFAWVLPTNVSLTDAPTFAADAVLALR